VPTVGCLRALGNAGHVGALVVDLATGYGDIGPSPASAGALTTGDDDVVATAGNVASDIVERQSGDRDTSIGVTVEVTTVIVLFNENAVPTRRQYSVRSKREGRVTHLEISDRVMSS
jgi:hypothetical protein